MSSLSSVMAEVASSLGCSALVCVDLGKGEVVGFTDVEGRYGAELQDLLGYAAADLLEGPTVKVLEVMNQESGGGDGAVGEVVVFRAGQAYVFMRVPGVGGFALGAVCEESRNANLLLIKCRQACSKMEAVLAGYVQKGGGGE